MSALQAVVAGCMGMRWRGITIGTLVGSSATYYGYSDGSIAPAVPGGGVLSNATVGAGINAPPVGGGVIEHLFSNELDFDLQLIIDPTGSAYAQDAFTGVLVVDATGAIRNYSTASATFSPGGAGSSWTWGTGSNPVFTAAVSGLIRNFLFY